MGAKIIAAFPACGKTTFYMKHSIYNIDNLSNNNALSDFMRIIDLDANDSLFEWKLNEDTNETYISHKDFPNNFIEYINNHIETEDIIFVSTNKKIINALRDANINYTLIYPDRNLKNEWINRFISRGNSDNFIQTFNNYWDKYFNEFESETFPTKIILSSNMIITMDLLDSI